MYVWVILYAFGQPVFTVGPVPYSLELCKTAARMRTAEIVGQLFKPNLEIKVDGRVVTKEDVQTGCMLSDFRPRLDVE